MEDKSINRLKKGLYMCTEDSSVRYCWIIQWSKCNRQLRKPLNGLVPEARMQMSERMGLCAVGSLLSVAAGSFCCWTCMGQWARSVCKAHHKTWSCYEEPFFVTSVSLNVVMVIWLSLVITLELWDWNDEGFWVLLIKAKNLTIEMSDAWQVWILQLEELQCFRTPRYGLVIASSLKLYFTRQNT